MNASDTLLDLCERLARDPDAMLESATGFSARSEDERRLFAALQAMLERIEERRRQQSAEHERAKAELAALRRQHELILSAAGEGIYGIDRAGLTTFVNPAAARLLGWEPAELLGRPAHAVLHHTRPDGKPYPHEERPIYATLQDGATHTDDTEVFWRRDGSSFPVEYVSTPIVERGELVGAVITFRDISKRKAVETQQRSSEAELQALFAAIRDVVLVLDGEGRYVKVAPTAPELLTHKVEELAGKTLYDVLPPHQAGEFLAHIRTALARQERVEHEYSLGLESGEHWFAASISPMDESRVVLVARDITERKRAEARLREKEEQYRSIFEGVTDGLVVTDLETGVLVTANPAAAQMHGYTLEEFVGLPAEAIVQPDHRHKLYAALEAVKTTGRFRQEAFDVRKDGTAFPVEVHGRTFIYLGKPHALGVIRDVTERKHAEARLREKEEQYRGIFDATGDGLLIRTLDGIIVEVNPAYCQMHGYERDELIGCHLTELIHPDYRHVLASTVKATSAGREYQTEGVNLRKDGSPLYVEARGTSFTYRGQPHILAIVRDITERKRAEAQVREKEEQYRSVFEASSDGLVVNDRDTGVVVAVNPAFARMHGYTVEELLGRGPTAFVHPDSYHLFADYLETVKAGREFRTQAVDIRKDGTPFPIEVHGTGFTYLGKPHCLGVVRDITERVQAYQLLERRVAERTRELATLLEVSHTLASTLELKPLLRLILDQLKVVADHSRASILLLEGDDLRVLDATWSAELAESQAINELSFSRERLGPIWEAICRQEPFILQDVWADDPMAEAFRAAAGEHYASHFRQVRAWLAVPLVVKNEVTGFLALSSTEPDYYTSHHADLALAVAQQAAIAIENARLYRQAQEEARKTAALARVASSVALGGSLETALTEVARNVVEASGAVASSMTLADGELPRLSLLGTYGLPEGYGEGIEAINRGGTWLLSAAGYYDPDPLVMRDVRQRLLANPAYAPIHRFLHQVPWDMLVSLPMVYQERHLGRLNLYYPPGREPGEDELAFLAAIASQAATAVENARLYDQAQALAALEERQRLARELHDSVSQALYGIALGSRTARTLLERDQPGLPEALEYITSLAAAGLAEMRALIFELRPESLESEGLVAALGKQAASVEARHRIEVRADLAGEPELPLETKEVLYRIAQEALHNTVKHAQARRVDLSLTQRDGGVVLDLRDDGIGFDPNQAFPGHLGLTSMRERVARLGGTIEIESAPGRGTAIRVRIPARQD